MRRVCLFLKTVRMMASPTAASAAATTITKKLKMWPSTLFELVGERYKAEIHSVQHQLNGHEHSDDIAPVQEARDAEAEQDRAQDQDTN